MSDPKAIDRALDDVERRIDKLKSESLPSFHPKLADLQRLYIQRERLHERQFKALQRRIARMAK